MSDDKLLDEITKAMTRKMCKHDVAQPSDRLGAILYPYCWHRPIKRLKYLRLMRRLATAYGRSHVARFIIPDELFES